MTKLSVRPAASDYDRTRALFKATVPIRGCEVIATATGPDETFYRALRFQGSDITGHSPSNYMIRSMTTCSMPHCTRSPSKDGSSSSPSPVGATGRQK